MVPDDSDNSDDNDKKFLVQTSSRGFDFTFDLYQHGLPVIQVHFAEFHAADNTVIEMTSGHHVGGIEKEEQGGHFGAGPGALRNYLFPQWLFCVTSSVLNECVCLSQNGRKKVMWH